MDNNDPIQQSNLVTDDAVSAMGGGPAPIGQAPGDPLVDQEATSPAPAAAPEPVAGPAPTPVATAPATPAEGGELDEIKKAALDELQPLLAHVEQPPEERYETIMMMIRTNDDSSLISQAYDAAREIADERERANALLNIVSEIEYLKSKNSN